jgi:oligopeptide/dipeptide ABC transporter ATP-binding protein
MSGGMRQRIVGAIGISCEPRLLIADEPTTSLDLTIQAQYLNLLREPAARARPGADLHHPQSRHRRQDVRPARRDVCRRVVEQGPVSRIFNAPAHPYTKALLGSIPRMTDNRASSPRSTASRPTSPPCRPAARSRRAARRRSPAAAPRRRPNSPSTTAARRAAGCRRAAIADAQAAK